MGDGWSDRADGCDYHAKCVTCPLIVCRLEISGGLPVAVALTRLAEMIPAGMPDSEMAKHLGYSLGHTRDLIKMGTGAGYFNRLPLALDQPWVDYLGLRMRRETAVMARAGLVEAEVEGYDLAALRRTDRIPAAARVRQRAMLALRRAGLQLVEIGYLLQRDHATVSWGCKRAAAREVANEECYAKPTCKVGEEAA